MAWKWRALALTILGSLWLMAEDGPAEETKRPHPLVPGFERFFAGSAADRTAGGRLLLSELNCVACHRAEDASSLLLLAHSAPILDAVGQRVRPEYLRAFLAAPHDVKPGTTMPDVLAAVPPGEKERQVEALVHFLASTGTPRERAVLESAAARGEELFHRVGCVACHQPQRGDMPHLATSVPLGSLTEKYTLPGLASFLRDPLRVRPAGRMPSLNLTEDEAREVASYLLRGLEVPGNVRFAYFEGNWDKLPNFRRLRSQTTGTAPGIDVGVGRRRDGFAVRFEAFLQIEREGEYRFHLGSDDGSQLWIDGELIVDNDGIHGMVWKEAAVRLSPGAHPVRIDYFEQGGEEVLHVEYEGPGVRRSPLDDALTLERERAPAEASNFRVDPALAAEGRTLFASSGCASCHVLHEGGAKLASALQAPPLAELAASQGCLSGEPPRGAPNFGLGSEQRAFLHAALEAASQGELRPRDDRAAVAHWLTAFNCYACHEREQIGGVEPERNAFFATTIPEMGDEGRLPPHLTGVGHKLRPEWLAQVVGQGAKDRPYLHARMPKFGTENAAPLVTLLTKVDHRPPLVRPESQQPTRRLKNLGHRLVGEQGLSCIKCHTFGDLGSTGIQAIALTTMHRRLNEDWFLRYLLDPAAFRPGTRMPAPWPGGVSLLPDILDGDAHQQIHAIWAYLGDGSRAAVPRGLLQSGMELIASDRAWVYRNFIEGAGPRAIGVGYPEKANLAFDAEGMRIALLWQGAFLDASRHWSGRGEGFQPPLGRNVLTLPEGAPLAVLDSPQSPWPTLAAKDQGYRFRGYRLDDLGRPTFLYEYAGVQVEDFPVAVETDDEPILRRTMRLHRAGAQGTLWLRAAVGPSIEQAGEWWVIDGDWRTRVAAENTDWVVRENAGRRELLAPLVFSDGVATVVQDYAW